MMIHSESQAHVEIEDDGVACALRLGSEDSVTAPSSMEFGVRDGSLTLRFQGPGAGSAPMSELTAPPAPTPVSCMPD